MGKGEKMSRFIDHLAFKLAERGIIIFPRRPLTAAGHTAPHIAAVRGYKVPSKYWDIQTFDGTTVKSLLSEV